MMSPYLLLIRSPGKKDFREFECSSERDMRDVWTVWAEDDDEVEFYDASHQIFPEWAQ